MYMNRKNSRWLSVPSLLISHHANKASKPHAGAGFMRLNNTAASEGFMPQSAASKPYSSVIIMRIYRNTVGSILTVRWVRFIPQSSASTLYSTVHIDPTV